MTTDTVPTETETRRQFTQEEAIYMRLTLKAIADMGKPRDVYHAYDLYTLVASTVKIALDMVPQ